MTLYLRSGGGARVAALILAESALEDRVALTVGSVCARINGGGDALAAAAAAVSVDNDAIGAAARLPMTMIVMRMTLSFGCFLAVFLIRV